MGHSDHLAKLADELEQEATLGENFPTSNAFRLIKRSTLREWSRTLRLAASAQEDAERVKRLEWDNASLRDALYVARIGSKARNLPALENCHCPDPDDCLDGGPACPLGEERKRRALAAEKGKP